MDVSIKLNIGFSLKNRALAVNEAVTKQRTAKVYVYQP